MGKKSRAKKIRRELVQVRTPSKEEAKKFLEGMPNDGWIENEDGYEHESGAWGMFGFTERKKHEH